MKVYVVYGNLCRVDDCDYKIHGVFDSSEKAVECAFKLGIETLKKWELPINRWSVCIPKDIDGAVFGIMDAEDFLVELFVVERELQAEVVIE